MKNLITAILLGSITTTFAWASTPIECRLSIPGIDRVIGKNINLEQTLKESLTQKGITLVSREELGNGDYTVSNLLKGNDSFLKIPLPNNEYLFKKKFHFIEMCIGLCNPIDVERVLSGRKFNQPFIVERISQDGNTTVARSTFKLKTRPMIVPELFDFNAEQEQLVKKISKTIPSCEKLSN